MKDGAVLANAGHFDIEIDLDALRGGRRPARARCCRCVEQYDGRRPQAEPAGQRPRGQPRRRPGPSRRRSWTCRSPTRRSRSSTSCATRGELGAGVHPVPEAVDREVARLKLESLGVEIDELTAEQRDYLRSWS